MRPSPFAVPRPSEAEIKAAEEASRQERARTIEDARLLYQLRVVDGWKRLERLIREQIQVFRNELENTDLSLDEVRGRQWQIHALSWILELPGVLQQKIERFDMIEQKAQESEARAKERP